MSEDEQRPVAATFEEAFRDVQPRPDLEATLMARYPELQVEAFGKVCQQILLPYLVAHLQQHCVSEEAGPWASTDLYEL